MDIIKFFTKNLITLIAIYFIVGHQPIKGQSKFFTEFRGSTNLNAPMIKFNIGYGGGLNLGFKYNKSFDLLAGLEYNQYNYYTQSHYLVKSIEQDVTYSSTYISPNIAIQLNLGNYRLRTGTMYLIHDETLKSGKRTYIWFTTPPNSNASNTRSDEFENESIELDDTLGFFFEIQRLIKFNKLLFFISSKYNYVVQPCDDNFEDCPPIQRSYINLSIGLNL